MKKYNDNTPNNLIHWLAGNCEGVRPPDYLAQKVGGVFNTVNQ